MYREVDKTFAYQRAASIRSAFGMLELYDGKLSCTVLRGRWGSNAPDLPDLKITNEEIQFNFIFCRS